MVEFLTLYQQYCNISDHIASEIQLQLSLVASNPKQTYLESMVKAYNTLQFGRSSREHPWIRMETDKRKSQKFGQDLCHVVKFMKNHDIEAMQEIMKQAPDFNTKDREAQKTPLQIALDKSKTQPSFSFVARYLALRQLMNKQHLEVRCHVSFPCIFTFFVCCYGLIEWKEEYIVFHSKRSDDGYVVFLCVCRRMRAQCCRHWIRTIRWWLRF